MTREIVDAIRRYYVKTRTAALGGLLLCGVWGSTAGSAVINFDDYPTPGTPANIPEAVIGDYYASSGVRFTNTWYAKQLEQSTFPSKSGLISATFSTSPAEIQFTVSVNRVGAYFNNYAFGALTFSAFNSSGLLGSVAIPATAQPTPGGPRYFELAFSGIERVTMAKSLPGFTSMDDLTFVVPEPTALSIALAALLMFRRR